jgi:hypothetical protein
MNIGLNKQNKKPPLNWERFRGIEKRTPENRGVRSAEIHYTSFQVAWQAQNLRFVGNDISCPRLTIPLFILCA